MLWEYAEGTHSLHRGPSRRINFTKLGRLRIQLKATIWRQYRGQLREFQDAWRVHCLLRSVYKGSRGPERTKKDMVRNSALIPCARRQLLDPARELSNQPVPSKGNQSFSNLTFSFWHFIPYIWNRSISRALPVTPLPSQAHDANQVLIRRPFTIFPFFSISTNTLL